MPENGRAAEPAAIGDLRIRPRIDGIFRQDERLGFYLQAQNVALDGTSRRRNGEIEYDVDGRSFAIVSVECPSTAPAEPGAGRVYATGAGNRQSRQPDDHRDGAIYPELVPVAQVAKRARHIAKRTQPLVLVARAAAVPASSRPAKRPISAELENEPNGGAARPCQEVA